MWTKRHQQSH